MGIVNISLFWVMAGCISSTVAPSIPEIRELLDSKVLHRLDPSSPQTLNPTWTLKNLSFWGSLLGFVLLYKSLKWQVIWG